MSMPQSQRLVRPRSGKVIAGVCAGLADRFGLGRNTVRFLFVLSCLLPGPQFVIYLALWLIMRHPPVARCRGSTSTVTSPPPGVTCVELRYSGGRAERTRSSYLAVTRSAPD